MDVCSWEDTEALEHFSESVVVAFPTVHKLSAYGYAGGLIVFVSGNLRLIGEKHDRNFSQVIDSLIYFVSTQILLQ